MASQGLGAPVPAPERRPASRRPPVRLRRHARRAGADLEDAGLPASTGRPGSPPIPPTSIRSSTPPTTRWWAPCPPRCALDETVRRLFAGISAGLGVTDRRASPTRLADALHRGRAARACATAPACWPRLARRHRLGIVSNFYGNLGAVCADAGLAPAVRRDRRLHARSAGASPIRGSSATPSTRSASSPAEATFVGDSPSARHGGRARRRHARTSGSSTPTAPPARRAARATASSARSTSSRGAAVSAVVRRAASSPRATAAGCAPAATPMPKALVPVGGVPLIEAAIAQLRGGRHPLAGDHRQRGMRAPAWTGCAAASPRSTPSSS